MKHNKLNNEELIRKEVEKTLNLLDDKNDADEPTINPYFYTKLMANYRARSEEPQKADFFDKVKIGILLPVLCALILIFNIITIAYKSKSQPQTTSTSRSELIQSFQQEYSLPMDNLISDYDGK